MKIEKIAHACEVEIVDEKKVLDAKKKIATLNQVFAMADILNYLVNLLV